VDEGPVARPPSVPGCPELVEVGGGLYDPRQLRETNAERTSAEEPFANPRNSAADPEAAIPASWRSGGWS
jgi:hypothetical protein